MKAITDYFYSQRQKYSELYGKKDSKHNQTIHRPLPGEKAFLLKKETSGDKTVEFLRVGSALKVNNSCGLLKSC